MKVLETGVAPKPDRPATRVVHDEPNVRIVEFHLAPGQVIPPHHSGSTVGIHVIEGEGLFRGDGEAVRLHAGQGAVYAPGETHSIRANGEALRFLAVLTPRPS